MNLEQLRKQSKELVRAARAGDPQALARLQAHAPRRARVLLADAQLTVAREHGHPSWPALVLAVEASAERFVLAGVTGRRARATSLLQARPAIAADPWAQLVLGQRWEGDPNAPGGPLDAAPLIYACHSSFPTLPLVRQLLARGANPNVEWSPREGRRTALSGAVRARDLAMMRALLEAGAEPNDGDSLYMACEADTPDCVRLLLEHGARPSGTNALAHALDFDRLEPVRLLLEAGFAPDREGPLLVHAVRRGRGAEFLRLLAAHGASLDAVGDEWSRRGGKARTAYQHAIRRGRQEEARTLAALGADTRLEAEDEALCLLSQGRPPPEVQTLEGLDEDGREIVVEAALGGQLALVVSLLGPQFRGPVGGGPEGTLLHYAAWRGDPALVRALLAAGADAEARSGARFDTPLAWAVLASAEEPGPEKDFVAIAEALVAAGAKVAPDWIDAADGPLAEWLAARD